MKLFRTRLVLTILTLTLVGGTSTAQAGVVPWMWNVLFGPPHARPLSPYNGYGYRPIYRPIYRPCLPRYRCAPITCAPVCNTGCSTVSYSSGLVVSPVSSSCEVSSAAKPEADPVSNQKYEDPAPVAAAGADGGQDGPTDIAPGDNGAAGIDEFSFDDPKPSRQQPADDFGPLEDEDWTRPIESGDVEPFEFRENQKPITDPTEGEDGEGGDGAGAEAGDQEGQTDPTEGMGKRDAAPARKFVSTISIDGPLTRDSQQNRSRVFTRTARTSVAARAPRWSPKVQLTAKR